MARTRATGRYFGDDTLRYARYDAGLEENAAVYVQSADNARIVGLTVRDMWGDAVTSGAERTTPFVSDLDADCLGRSGVSMSTRR